jgi:TonB-dependent SusC/RagA subfamily outer membrane receptor
MEHYSFVHHTDNTNLTRPMKLRLSLVVILSFAVVPLLAQSDFYTKSWSRVYRHEAKSLTKSALEAVDTIYHKAKREKNTPQLTKALLYQSKFALTLQEDAELEIIRRFEKEISESSFPQRNILSGILARIYWEYLQQNRYVIFQRSVVNDATSNDFRTWDARLFFREIHRHFRSALHHPIQLQRISLDTIDEILINAENSRLYRPTLYDFLAHMALDFYQAEESSLITPANKFVVDDIGYLNNFEAIAIAAPDSLAPLAEALKIYQSLLAFHKKDTLAYVNVELERLQLVIGSGTFPNGDELHKTALKKISDTYRSHPASALADYELARMLFDEGQDYTPAKKDNQFKKAEAMAICNRVIETFPESHGGEKCAIMKKQMMTSSLSLQSETFIPVNKPSLIQISYKNISSLSFAAYPVTAEYYERLISRMNDTTMLAEIKKLKPAAQWQVALKNLRDYQTHTTEIAAPGFPSGDFLVFAQVLDSLQQHTAIFAHSYVHVTNLAFLESRTPTTMRYQIVDRNTGTPIQSADVYLQSDTTKDKSFLNKHFTTDRDGFVELKRNNFYDHITATVTYKEDSAVFGELWIYQDYDREPDSETYNAKVFLFTDRSIYRPGQTVYFKGIMLKIINKKSTIVTGEYVEVFLEDANGEDVTSLRLKTNAYGSFSGEFKLPSSGLTGEFNIRADEDYEEDSRFYDNLNNFEYSDLTISVEEYKRPTFEVSFKPVTGIFKLKETVTVTGTAQAFNGSKISNAQAKYTVTRMARFPYWDFYLRQPDNYGEEEEIASGATTTDKDGAFSISFEAIAPEKINEADRPMFHYKVTVDVTDINGETRTASTTVKVASYSLLVDLRGPSSFSKKKPNGVLSISSENLNGQYVPSKGTIRIFKLQSPETPVRQRPWEAPDAPLMTVEEFKKFFPHEAYGDESDPDRWRKGTQVHVTSFDTEKSKDVKFLIDASWKSGAYVAELSTTDPSGAIVTDTHRFKIDETGNKDIADNELLIFENDKLSYSIGEVVRLKIGSASQDITFTIDLERDHKIIKTYVEHLSHQSKVIIIPVTEGMAEGFAINCTAVNYNHFMFKRNLVQVQGPDDRLEINTITFKDKLQPGAKETWSFEVTGKNAEKKQAEVLASMYDASLDQFKTHEWSFSPGDRSGYYSYFGVSSHYGFGQNPFSVTNQSTYFFTTPQQYFDELDWFGFSIANSIYVQNDYRERLYMIANSENPSTVSMKNTRNRPAGYIYGQIISSDGSPLPGVNVLVKGTSNGTTTDMNGSYAIRASRGDELVFTFVGYSTASTIVGKKNTIDVLMQEDITALSEVVVVGYSVQPVKKFSGVVTALSVADSTGSAVFLAEPLAGRAAGVQVTGIPGGDMTMMIRGNGSAAGAAMPLYVVDGVIVAGYKVDKDDIANIQVLQGSAATKLYGAKAAGGVIIIDTKSGQAKLDEELAKITARKNFNETAFFFPHLTTSEEGRIRFTFTTPESVTRWKMQLLAHTKDLVVGMKTMQAVTQKELMVTPNAPRFIRAGDALTFSTKITNLTSQIKEGKIGLQLTDEKTGESVDLLFGNTVKNLSFKTEAKGNAEVSWKLKVPAGVDAIQYRVVAKTGNFSDGEQNFLPVLSNRQLVTESVPMYVRSGQTKTYRLDKLASTTSTTLQHHQLTLEVTSNPAWYAIQALPYLMEFPYECAEQLFARYYANTLASHIANSNPRIKAVFDQWASSDVLISNLEKNQELKSMIIAETPWLRDAQSETEQKKRIGMLFDLTNTNDQSKGVIFKLQQMQFESGGFPWFAGSHTASYYITQHIAAGLGHLMQLKALPEGKDVKGIMTKAVTFLDAATLREYNKLIKTAGEIRTNAKTTQEGEQAVKKYLDEISPSNDVIHYLYMRSFYPDSTISKELQSAIAYYTVQSGKKWENRNLYMKGMTALVQHRKGDRQLATAIVKALKENAVMSDEMGMYWKENKAGWYWHESPIETQALLMEAFSEIESADGKIREAEKRKSIDEMGLWLLKNKQTSQWKTTRATTEAIYALMLQSSSWTSLDKKVEVVVGAKKIEVDKSAEAGTGYFKTSWKSDAVKNDMSEVTISKKDEGVAWAGLYWQYFEDLDKITGAETPLKLSKKVFIVTRTEGKESLTEVNGNVAVKVGDLLRIRIELKADRPMEFLHMKDMRASGLEPVDVLSEYKWQEGIGYYQSTRDASTNFFFDYVSTGVYVFEYDLRANNKGDFSNGIATIQSMYAPEFGSHSEGIRLKIE